MTTEYPNDSGLRSLSVEIHGKDTEDGFSRTCHVYVRDGDEFNKLIAEVETRGWRVSGFVTIVEDFTAALALARLEEYAKTEMH